MKYFYLLDDFYLNVKNKEQNFKGNYDNLNFLNMDFNYFLKLKNKYKINDFLDYDTETDFYIDAEMYTIPYKPNKYKITNFKEIIGLYITCLLYTSANLIFVPHFQGQNNTNAALPSLGLSTLFSYPHFSGQNNTLCLLYTS